MKTRKITVLLLMIPFLVMSQKEKNGKVYKNHPAIAIVNQFNKAYVDGDVETLRIPWVGSSHPAGYRMPPHPATGI